MKALVIGGTGPSGRYVVEGLLARGYEVALLHRGVHEDRSVDDVPHIHADPHFSDTLAYAVDSNYFDVVVATYGRIKVIADVFVNRCRQLVCVGGVPVYEGLIEPESRRPYGMRLLAREDSPLADAAGRAPRFAHLVLDAERAVLNHCWRGLYQATVVRYPLIYGPRNVVPWEWAVIKRALDGRTRMVLPDDGLWIMSRCAARNAAEALLCVVDRPEIASGQVYNCADHEQYTIRQWAESVAAIMGVEMEFVGIPSQIAPSALAEFLPVDSRPHMLVDAGKIERELGYREAVPATQALEEVVRWLLDNPVTSSDYPLYPARFDYQHEDRLIEAYQQAAAKVRRVVPDARPVAPHPMPHPKTPHPRIVHPGRSQEPGTVVENGA